MFTWLWVCIPSKQVVGRKRALINILRLLFSSFFKLLGQNVTIKNICLKIILTNKKKIFDQL